MIKILFQLAILSLLTFSCTSGTSEENANSTSSQTPLTLENKVTDNYIPDEINKSITSKRRAKLGKLYADGPSWFQFRITKPFTDLKINLTGNEYTHSMSWNTESPDTSDDPLQIQKVNQGDFNVDIIVTAGKIDVFFNEGLESFSFKTKNQVIDARVQLILDGIEEDIPGVLFDLGV